MSVFFIYLKSKVSTLMKKIILFFCMMISSCVFSQDSIQILPDRFTEVVVNVNGKNAAEIYSSVRTWMNKKIISANNSFIADDSGKYLKASGTTFYTLNVFGKSKYRMIFDIEVEIQDNKYKIAFLNVISPELADEKIPQTMFKKDGSIKGNKKANREMQKSIKDEINQIHFDLKDYITTGQRW